MYVGSDCRLKMINNYVTKSDPMRSRVVRSDFDIKQLHRVQARKVRYRVGYNWNKGGRLKELRIRHLARKFLKIWMHNTFGRILPHKARLHYNCSVLRRAFEGWRDEWWVSRREWCLAMRAECHHRYYLSTWAFHRWRQFISLQREKKVKIQSAQSLADRRLMRLVWDKWRVFPEVGRTRRRILESALEQKRLSALHSTWNLWQTRLQQQQELYTLEDQSLKQKALGLQRKAWLQWKERHRAACCQKKKESKAALHFVLNLKRRTFSFWKSYISLRKTKKHAQAVAQRAHCLLLVRKCWSKWRNALELRLSAETRLQAVSHLAVRSTKRRALECWKAHVNLCRDEAERNRLAQQHFQHHLLRDGLRRLSLNVTQSKTHRLNNNMAVQHCQQTMMSKYWKQWKERLEEAEDRSFQPLTEMAQTKYRMLLLRSGFDLWREKLAKRREMQEMEHCADSWFAERKLSEYLKMWVELTRQEQRRHRAEAFDRQRQYAWVFYTWWRQLERHKEEMLSVRMAVLHDERRHLQRAWVRWRRRTQQQMEEAEKQVAAHQLYIQRLLHSTVMQWKRNSSEIQDRRNREQQACRQGDLHWMRWAVEKWKKFVQIQREKKSRLKQIQSYHEVKLLKHSFIAWKKHHVQMTQMDEHAEELYRQKTHRFLRNVLTVWREKAALQIEVRVAEQQAQDHCQRSLQLKMLLIWREATTGAVLKRRQQEAALSQTQWTLDQAQLQRSFRHWRKQTREAWRQRRNMERAGRHHNSKLLSKTLTTWNKFHQQHQRKKVMKRQGLLLLRLNMYQKYFEQWKIKLQHRRREANQTEQALWHWSLTLQAKVLFSWRLWVTEQRSKREQAARAAQVYRDQLLREGVTCILTYAAHMNDLTTSLTQFSQEHRSQRLQRVVKRCAMRWKQRALCKPPKDQEVQPPKKSVTFCLPEPALGSVLTSDSEGQEDGALRHTQKELGLSSTEAALKAFEFSCSSHTDRPESKNQDYLLPPSAFMTSRTQRAFSSCSGPEEAPLLPFYHSTPPSKHHPDSHLKPVRRTSEDPPVDDESALTRELLSIQQDMKSFQQSRKQLRAWRKLREVLQSWLQTSAEDEQMEKTAVCKELKELEERIGRLSTELEERKPTMQLHAERIQHLQSVLQTSGVPPLS